MASTAGSGLIEALDAALPGPALAALLADVLGTSHSESERIAIASAWQRMSAWAEAGLARAIVDVMGPEEEADEILVNDRVLILTDMTRHELGAALRLTPGQVRNRIRNARTLVVDLPAVHQSLTCGHITARQATLFVDAAHRMALGIDHADPASAAEHEERLLELCESALPFAIRCDERTLARRLGIVVSRIDADGCVRRATAARRHCVGVRVQHEDDGISTLIATLPSEHAVACWEAVAALAESNAATDPSAPVGMLRAQALADLVLRAQNGEPSAETPRVHVNLVMDLTTFLGLNDGAAELVGAGQIPASVARELIANDDDATMQRLIADPLRRRLLDLSPDRYAIGPRVRRFLEARDQRCRFPGCTQRAQRCDIDHARAFADGGRTTMENLGALCRAHHQAKTHGGWSISRSESSGDCTWVSPNGRTFRHVTEPLLDGDVAQQCGHCTAHPSPLWHSPLEHHAAHLLDAPAY